ncbi:MAG: membrane-bound PQQ-dependent dehydrogenase, glucose/quinate/shikimate family, partial [Pseudomonadota bacterium]
MVAVAASIATLWVLQRILMQREAITLTVAAVGATVYCVALLAGGGWLSWLGGSPYYLLAGAGLLLTAVLLVRRHPGAGLAYAVVLAATLIWAVWEAGFVFWPLLPRLFAPAVLGLFVLLVLFSAPKAQLRTWSALAVGVLSLACVSVLGA